MCDLTVINPTNHTFKTGNNINVPCEIGIIAPGNPAVGSGTVSTYVSNSMSGSGSYSAVGKSGQWTVSLTQNANETWAVTINLTGSLAGNSRSFTASCNQDTGGTPTLRFTDVNDSSTYVVVEQNNGSIFTSGKINISASWVPVTLYLYNNS